MRRAQSVIQAIPLLLIFVALSPTHIGCLGDSNTRSPNTLDSQRVSNTQKATIAREEAIAIANKHFGRSENAGCYFDDRGRYFFVAPPIKVKAQLERSGVYIDKATGELFETKPEE